MTILESQLAIEGGEPSRKRPFPSWPQFDPAAIDAVAAVLRSGKVNYWTGEEGQNFEREFAAYVGTAHAVAVANGTVALELALHAAGVGPGDDVITPCRTFIASASCIHARGATAVMADVDRESQNLTADSIARAITPRTRAVIAVHLAGWPCDMDPILELARTRNLIVIEDCAQALGSRDKGRMTGSMGHVAAFSFCQDKVLTTGGEGGMVVTNDRRLWERAWSYKDHGKSYDAVYHRPHGTGYRWLHESFGTNLRLTEMQSALGRYALPNLDSQIETRRGFSARLSQAFAEIAALRTTIPRPEVHHSYYKYYVFLRPERLRDGWSRDRVIEAISAEGIPCFSGACPEVYLEKAFAGMRPQQRLPVAAELGETSLMFLVHPTLTAADIEDTIAAVRKVMAHAARSNS